MAPVRLVGALLALVTLLLFAQVAGFDFVNYDDPEYVAENPRVLQGITASGTAWAFRTFHFSNWHPLTWLSHMLDVEVFGAQPGAHHLVNLLLHTVNVLLLYALLLRWTGAVWAAGFVAALFAWHPLRVESVAWIAERKDVLCATFAFLALHAYTAYARAPRPWRMALVSLCLALGLMAKPMLVTLPFVFLLLDVWPLGRRPWPPADLRSWGASLLEKWPLFALVAASCVLTVAAQKAAAIRTLEEVPWDLRLANAAVATAAYLVNTIWPTDLSVFYPLPRALPGLLVAVCVALLAGLSWLAWRQRVRRPWLLVGWLWFLGMLVPVSGLVAIGGHARADRYMYLPQLGLFLMLAWTVRDQVLAGWWTVRAVAAAGALALVCGAAVTWRQLAHWRDSESLFQHALRVNPANAMAHINLGAWQERQGRQAEALTNYLAALRLQPGRAHVHNNLGNVLDALGRPEEAIGHYQEALRLKPGTALVHRNLGASLAGRGRHAEAMAQYEEALRLAPEDAQLRYLIGMAWLRQGQTRAALPPLREALRLHPGHARALDQLARLLATDEDPALRDGAEAVRLASRAVDVTGGEQPQALDTLGMALAEAGRFDEAVAAARRAVELLDAIGEPGQAAAVRGRMALYHARQPWRDPRPLR